MKKKLLFVLAQLVYLQGFSQPCIENFTSQIPISECSKIYVQDKLGGKYPNGKNAIPYPHFKVGMGKSKEIKSIDRNGHENIESGKIGFLILGFSTAAMTGRYLKILHQILFPNSQIQFLIGAQGGQDLNSMVNSKSNYWKNIDSILLANKMHASQIQFIWISTGDISVQKLSMHDQIETETKKYQLALKNIKEKYTQIKIVFLSDRPYAGYINSRNGPMELSEPTAYYHSWTVKSVIEKQLTNVSGFSYSEIPFIDWGQTLWTDGSKGNAKGYTWNCNDAGKGGIHPTAKGRVKESVILLLFFTHHPYMRNHF